MKLLINSAMLFTFTFSKTDISLSVNKVGKTLLLDEFDVQSVLSHAAQVTKLVYFGHTIGTIEIFSIDRELSIFFLFSILIF